MTRREEFLTKAAKIANVVLLGGATLSTLVFLYFLYRYGWTGERRLAGWMVTYFVAPGLLAACFFASLKLKPVHKINLAVVCISLVACLYAAESLLHASRSVFLNRYRPVMNIDGASEEQRGELQEFVKRRFGVDADVRKRIDVIADLRAQGIDAVPSVIPRHLLSKQKDESMQSEIRIGGTEIIPFGGIAGKATLLCNESGAYVTYQSDEHGFHNPTGIWRSERIDIAALGDSYVQGYCVPSDRSFVGLIRRQHPATLNVGMAGQGPLLMLAALKEYLPAYKPKVVLWFYFEGNDLANLDEEKRSRVLMRYLEPGFTQGLRGRQKDIDRALVEFAESQKARMLAQARKRQGWAVVVAKFVSLIKLSTLRGRLGLYVDEKENHDAFPARGTFHMTDTFKPDMNLFRETLTQARKKASEWGGELDFVYLPDWARYSKAANSVNLQQRAAVLAMVRDLGIPVIDIHPVFEFQDDPLSLFPFHSVGHYTEEGHGLVAGEVLKKISVQNSTGPRARQPTSAGALNDRFHR